MNVIKTVMWRGLQIGTGFLIGGSAVSSNFGRHVDQDLISPWRDYHATLTDYGHFRTEEDALDFLSNFREGSGRFGSYCFGGFKD